MGHKIDLSNYKIRTDLAIEAIGNKEGIRTEFTSIGDIKITRVNIDENNGKIIDKKAGNYITIEFSDITDFDNKEKVKKIFSDELKKLLNIIHIKDNDSVLVIGLGNDKSTPDALGPLAVDNILVTKYLFSLGNVEEGFREVSAISPGVMGETGIETSDLIKSIVNTVKPNLVIAIDALASQSLERVNQTIQITDSGIHPGSGIGNKRKEISSDILNIPVIAIGVPTVVDAVTIVSDTINYMYKHFSYTKENMNNPVNRLISSGVNYLNKNVKIDEHDKSKLFGIVGNLGADEVKQLIFEVLSPIGYNLMVTPKEVDFVMEKLSDVIGNGINEALHKQVNKL